MNIILHIQLSVVASLIMHKDYIEIQRMLAFKIYTISFRDVFLKFDMCNLY